MSASNDSPIEVQVEILAAEAMGLDFTAGQLLGWMAHEDGRCTDWPPATPGAIDWWAGWLCREIATHDDESEVFRDPSAWPWDPTRPVAGQYEGWLARRAEVDAFASDAPDPSTKFDEMAQQTVTPIERIEDGLRHLDGIDQSEPEPAQSIDLGGEAGE